MIYFVLILFFASLISIIFMIGKKLVLIKNGKHEVQEGVSFEIPYLEETKGLLFRNIKRYEHLSLVAMVRSYVQLTNFLKNKHEEVKTKITHKFHRNTKLLESDTSGKQEASKFLKMISDYKHKITEIKHKIHEEEKDL